MNLLFFTENFYKGGLDTIIVSLCNHWPYPEDSITLLCNASHPGLETYREKITNPAVRILPHEWPLFASAQERMPRRWWRKPLIPFLKYGLFLYAVFKVTRLCRQHHIERVLSLNGGYPGGDSCRAASIAARLVCGRTGVHSIHSLAGRSPRLLRPVENIIDAAVGNASAAATAVSHACAASLGERPALVKRIRIVPIYNGVDLHVRPQSEHFKKELRIPGSSPLLVMLGTYVPCKGHAFLLEAFSRIHAALPGAHLVFCGGGSEEERDLVRRLIPERLLRNVHCLGFVTDAATLIREADIILSGSQAYESFGLTPVEAALAGKPSVVTDVGGLLEVVRDGETGFVVPHDRPDLFAQKVVELLDNAVLRETLGKKACQRAIKDFSVQRMVKTYADLLRENSDRRNAHGA